MREIKDGAECTKSRIVMSDSMIFECNSKNQRWLLGMDMECLKCL